MTVAGAVTVEPGAGQIGVVVVNWNSGEQLRRCLGSLAEQQAEAAVAQVVVVDNASSDGSADDLESLELPLKVVRNPLNRGFGAACNQGARLVDCEFVLFLNPDTTLFQGSLDAPLVFMRRPENGSVGICGVQLVDEDGRIATSCSRFPSLGRFAAKAFGLTVLPGLRRLGVRMAEWGHADTRDVDQVMGAFFLIRRRLFEDLGGFDERFFVYFEEVDLSLRARRAGWRSVFLAEARVFHAGGGTSRQVKARRLFYSLRSRLLYGFKHFTRGQAWSLVALTLLVEPVSRLLLALAAGRGSEALHTLRGYAMLLRELPKIAAHPVPRPADVQRG